MVTVVTSDGSGSGFAVGDGEGATQLVTNFHVVATDYAAGRRTVAVTRGQSRWSGRVVEVFGPEGLHGYQQLKTIYLGPPS